MTDTLRSTDFETLLATLDEQQDRKVDLVLPGTDMCFGGGDLRVRRGDLEPVITESGVSPVVQTFSSTDVFDEGLAAKLGFPRAYLRKLREQGWTDIIDGTFNALFQGKQGIREPEGRRFLLRALKDADGGEVGSARALLSDSYKIVDHIDTLRAALAGMKAAGLGAENVTSCDLTGRRMYVTVECPEVRANATELLKDYRSPFTGNRGADNPIVHAGFVLGNSETGHGTFFLYPRIVAEVCTNGMTIKKDVGALVQRHLGAKLDDGIVEYSNETREQNRRLIMSMAQDTVRTFMTEGYLNRVVRKLEEKAGAPVEKPETAIKEVTQKLEIPALYDDVLTHFIKGGDMTRGGVMHAVTAAAQSTDIDADTAFRMEEKATAMLLG